MPQLNPNPWFMILIMSWLILLTIIPQKVISHQTFNEPMSQNTEKPKPKPWNWPWS
uniref:ATP synthase complex subunit 8 n=1 Tax=Hymenochirus boettgeri TaxID=247094 RepID=F6KD87_9PIPI|nr:ATP synthase F0 subunit 8 [Hymenochirus boettgeri]ADM35674.1 ATP synthase F0 subunit 8 [Hymenochirus boettgeri]